MRLLFYIYMGGGRLRTAGYRRRLAAGARLVTAGCGLLMVGCGSEEPLSSIDEQAKGFNLGREEVVESVTTERVHIGGEGATADGGGQQTADSGRQAASGRRQTHYSMAFVLLYPTGVEVSQETWEKVDDLRMNFPEAFSRATAGNAEITTDYPLQVMELKELDFKEISRAFYMDNPDGFDFLSLYSEEIDLSPGNIQHIMVKNQIVGIGKSVFDHSQEFGSGGRLLGINVMHHFNEIYHKIYIEVFAMNGLLHETGHHWCCYVGDEFGSGGELEIIDKYNHFYRGLESPYESGTAMNSDFWVEKEDGNFRRANNPFLGEKYHPFQLYFMGLLPEDEWNRKYRIFDAGVGRDFNPERAVFYKEVSVLDIIEVEGERR